MLTFYRQLSFCCVCSHTEVRRAVQGVLSSLHDAQAKKKKREKEKEKKQKKKESKEKRS